MKTHILLLLSLSLAFSLVANAKEKKKDKAAAAPTSSEKVKEEPKAEKKKAVKEDEDEAAEEEVTVQTPAPKAEPATVGGPVNVHSVGLGIGETFLFGEFKDNGDNRIAFPDIFYQYSASHTFDALVNFHYSKHKYEKQDVRLMGFATDIKAKLYQFDAFAPFAMAGLGFYYPKTHRIYNGVVYDSEGKWAFGFNLGIGAELRLNRHVLVGVQTQLHKPFNVKQDHQPKVKGAYETLLITGMYTF